MQIVQKIYIECQEMMPDMKIKTGHFWFQGQKYNILNGSVIPDASTYKTQGE